MEDHYVTREEYAELLAVARSGRVSIWTMIVNTILWMSAGGALAFAVLVFMPVGSDAPAPVAAPPSVKVSAPVPSGGASYTTSGGRLPPCSTVQDTRTACEQDQIEQAPVAAQEAPTAAATAPPTPAHESACWTIPGERPCWLPADQPWEAPQEVPETPIVLLPAPPLVFSDSPCAAWHPPLPWPEECGDE